MKQLTEKELKKIYNGNVIAIPFNADFKALIVSNLS